MRMACATLGRMYRPDEGVFAFRIRRDGAADRLEGASDRYTAISLIGLATRDERTAQASLRGLSRIDVCRRLVERAARSDCLGDVALAIWAARALGDVDVDAAVRRLRMLDPVNGDHPTVELAWALVALINDGRVPGDDVQAAGVAQRLMAMFHPTSALFPHHPPESRRAGGRSHVACFADLVYPTHALARYGQMTDRAEPCDIARACAEKMCALQGAQGQWWWHYDYRTGRVLERYPVYAVHQDAMGQMALFAAMEACGTDYAKWIDRSLDWLVCADEIKGTLIDRAAGIIWRKVGRREPGKLTRGMQAGISRVHSALRIPGVDLFFPPLCIDAESRPYHMGWILYAWSMKAAKPWLHGAPDHADDLESTQLASPSSV